MIPACVRAASAADSVSITGQAQALTKVQYNRGTCNVQARSLNPSALHYRFAQVPCQAHDAGIRCCHLR